MKRPSRLLTFCDSQTRIFRPAPPDLALTFNPQPLANLGNASLELDRSYFAGKRGHAGCRRGQRLTKFIWLAERNFHFPEDVCR